MKKRAPEVTQETIDAARKPMTAKERAVYDRVTREWRPAVGRGNQTVLDSLEEKGWVDKTRYEGQWVYQRRHSLD